jgi:tetratricopeptide (TPR) repeat protein
MRSLFNLAYHWFYKQLGIWSGILGKNGLAAEFWVKAHSFTPGRAKELITAANYLALSGDMAGSESLLRRSIEIDRSQASAWFNLGFLLQKREEHAQAIEAFNEALLQNEKLDRAHYGRALSLMNLNRNEEAKAALQRTVELQPMSPYGYYHLAVLQFKMGDEKSFKKITRKLSGFEPKLALQLQQETGIDAGVKDPFK